MEAGKAASVSGEVLGNLLQAQLNVQGETWALAKPAPLRRDVLLRFAGQAEGSRVCSQARWHGSIVLST